MQYYNIFVRNIIYEYKLDFRSFSVTLYSSESIINQVNISESINLQQRELDLLVQSPYLIFTYDTATICVNVNNMQ